LEEHLSEEQGVVSSILTGTTIYFGGVLRIIVCGSRSIKDKHAVWELLNQIEPTVIFHGGAKGADVLAKLWANLNSVEQVEIKADWTTHGKAAGPIRNQLILDRFGDAVDEVWAFVDKPLETSKGTFDMVSRCKKRDLTVHVVEL
jgi:hypothetical protein